MKEKKLTDEEILQDLIDHKNAAETYGFVQITPALIKPWLDLIHRQKAEIEQARKETAKEIFDEYGYLLSKRAKDEFKERYGVEVE